MNNQANPTVDLRHLVALAVPAAISVVLNNAFRVIDQFAVQWLGVAAQAAIASTTFVLIAAFALFALVSAGAGPLVARAIGSGDGLLLKRATGNALTGSTVLGVVVLALMGATADLIATTVGLEGEAARAAEVYLTTLAWVGLPLALAPTIDAVFISHGRTRVVMVLQLVATGLNIGLNPLFIYTLDMGIAGAAVATGISRGVSVSIGLWMLWREVQPSVVDLRLDATLFRMVRVGWPICVGTLFYAGVYWALLAVAISPLGPAVIAALGVGFNALEGFTWPVYWGFSVAVASLVGRQLGAGDPDGAVRTYRLAQPLMGGVGLLAALVFWFGGEPLSALFTDDPEVLREATRYAQILAFSQVFVAWEALSEGVLEGAGATRILLWWSAPLNLLRVPLGWFLAFPMDMGAAGVWWAINLTTIAKCAGKWVAVFRGRWKELSI